MCISEVESFEEIGYKWQHVKETQNTLRVSKEPQKSLRC